MSTIRDKVDILFRLRQQNPNAPISDLLIDEIVQLQITVEGQSGLIDILEDQLKFANLKSDTWKAACLRLRDVILSQRKE